MSLRFRGSGVDSQIGIVATLVTTMAILTAVLAMDSVRPLVAAEAGNSSADKRGVPSEAEQETATKVVREIFDKDFRAAKTPQEKTELAKKVVRQAADTKDDPTSQYVLLEVARKIAVGAGNAALAMEIVQQVAEQYDIDRERILGETVAATFKDKIPVEQRKANLESARRAIDALVAADGYDHAIQLASAARDAARGLAVPAVAKEFDLRLRQLRHELALRAPVEEAKKKLRLSPDDPEACGTVGKYLCLVRDEWAAGLPLLVKGSDTALKDLAVQEMGDPREATARLRLADAWREAANQAAADEQGILLKRAAYWYRQSMADLSGLDLARAKKRIEEIEKQSPSPVATAEPVKGSGPKAKPAAGPPEKRTGMIFAACDMSFQMYINGNRVLGGSGARVATLKYDFQAGDVVMVHAMNSSGSHGFACVIVFEPAATAKRKKQPLVVATGPNSGWQSYLPKDPDRWFDPQGIGATGPPFAGDATQHRIVSAAAGVPCMCIWGNRTVLTSYLTLPIRFSNK